VTIRVYLVDDHEVVRRGLRELLEVEDDLEVVGDSSTAGEAVRRIPALRPDVAVLDARLPDGSGIDVCREVRSIDPSIKVDPHLVRRRRGPVAAIMAGASGYVLKNVRGTDLVDGIRRVATGSPCSTRASPRGCWTSPGGT
jgi:DNA-binding NarL/FixJ family response regulator